MNSINLYFLSKIEDCEEFAIYEKRLSMRAQALSVREHERASLHAFVSCASASGASLQDFDSFYYNYSISQIGKEFDLLKITPDSILNIELKSQEIEFDKIETQLRRNKHYLRHLMQILRTKQKRSSTIIVTKIILLSTTPLQYTIPALLINIPAA